MGAGWRVARSRLSTVVCPDQAAGKNKRNSGLKMCTGPVADAIPLRCATSNNCLWRNPTCLLEKPPTGHRLMALSSMVWHPMIAFVSQRALDAVGLRKGG
jgi:hypothetical protein